jgi:UDP-N-acetylmuramoyl-tripeptide--D-alanyl-D-alanine ligase
MTFWTLDRAADALAPVARGALPRSGQAFPRVHTDTRTLARGDLFVALQGEHFDAHDFLDEAVQAGAAALVVSDARRAGRTGVPTLEVRDTTEALGALGRYHRRAWARPVVAIAGSNGKTSTKELTAAALGSRLAVHATRGNLNNQVGVPLTLLALPIDADIAVVEIGTNHPGEVALLRDVVEPDITVVTSIGEEHLEGLIDLDGVLREESEACRDVPIAVVPAVHPELVDAARRLARHVVVAGLDAGDVRPDRWGMNGDGFGWLVFGDCTITSPLRGEHNLRNAMLAIAVAQRCGISIEDAARGMATTPALSMRSAWLEVGTLRVLNDAYNANPASAREALRLLASLDTQRQRVVVLGTMRELGPQAPALHVDVARRALETPAAIIAGIGDFATALRSVAPNDARVVTAGDVDDLWPQLESRLARDAVVLLKASRGVKLERMMPLLTNFAANGTR